LGTQALQLDNVYSAVSSSSGTLTNLNKAGWISFTSLTDTSLYSFALTGFTVAPNCYTTVTNDPRVASISLISATSITVRVINSTSDAKIADAFNIICQKSGNDYLASSAAVYSQASANYSRTAYTPTFTGMTVSSSECYHSREGEFLDIDCKFTTTAVSAAIPTFTLPNSLLTSAAIPSVMYFGQGGSSIASSALFVHLLGTASSNTLTISFKQSTESMLNTPLANAFMPASGIYTFHARVPISGWSNGANITGSFQGYNSTPGITNPKTYSATISAAGVVSSEKGDFINGSCVVTDTSLYTCTWTAGFWTQAPNCVAMPIGAGALNETISNESAATTTSGIFRGQVALVKTASAFQLICHGE
jgi:hypothetical protein